MSDALTDYYCAVCGTGFASRMRCQLHESDVHDRPMTDPTADPVDTDALRGKARVLWKRGAIARGFGDESDVEEADIDQDASRLLRAAADEVDRLRAVIEDAPHPIECKRGNSGNLRVPCTCWKADALS